MEQIKLFDSELKLMELIWEHSPVSAKELTRLAGGSIGWNKNTTYTILKKLIQKNAVKRDEPNFICSPIITKEQVFKSETKSLIDKLFSGSKGAFVSAFFKTEEFTAEEIEEIRKIIEKSGD